MEIKDKKRFLKWFWIIMFSPIILVLLVLFLVGVFADVPSFAELEDPKSNLATQILAQDGELLTTFHIENRSYTTFQELSQSLKDAIVATVNARFYSQSGIDLKSLAKGVVKTLVL